MGSYDINMKAIMVDKLVKQYKSGVKALNELSLDVNRGEIFALIGPNGAGKSSLINILNTFLSPTSGKVSVLGRDIKNEQNYIRTLIACVSQQVSIDMHLSLNENMMFQSKLYKVDSSTAKNRINNLLDIFGLKQYLKYPVASYSGGIKRRLDIAMNMMSHPEILFLDEPTVGMDVQSRKAMWDMMRKIRDEFGTTIFLTTHYLEEADELSDTICIMKDGHELVQDSPKNLRRFIHQNMIRITLSCKDKAHEYAHNLSELSIIKTLRLNGNVLYAYVNDCKNEFKELIRFLLEHEVDFISIEIAEASLEDVFLALTGKEERIH